jgi:peptide subunit release factor 1 (eRF1)
MRKAIKKGSVKIRGVEYEFTDKELFDKRVKVKIPSFFNLMNEGTQPVKYSVDKMPNVIYKNNDNSISITLNLTNHNLKEGQVETFTDEVKSTLVNYHPSIKLFKTGITKNVKNEIGYFDFITHSVDTDIYNLMFITYLDNRALMCVVNCAEKYMEDWKTISKGIMDTLVVE